MLAVAALHNCGVVPLVWRNFPEKIDEASPAWKALARFDITDAEFVPYWRNQQFVKLDHTKRYFASFYRKNGQCLFVVSNLTWDKADIPVQINFAALGLRGVVQDINTGETIEVKNGGILLKIPFYQARFLLVK